MTGSLDKSMCMNAYISLNFTDKGSVAHNSQIIIKYPIFFLVNFMRQLILTEYFCWFLLSSHIHSKPMVAIQPLFD